MAEIGKLGQEMTAWFDFGEGGKMEIAFLPKNRLEAIYKRHTKQVFKKGTWREDTDFEKANMELGRTVLRNWKGLTTEGVELPFNDENRDRAMRESYEISGFVNEKCVEVQEFIERRQEDAVKKSGPMPSGGQKA